MSGLACHHHLHPAAGGQDIWTFITGQTAHWIAQSVTQLVPAGICPYDKVVCLVVDECHKATGKYDIVTAVKKMQATGCKFRVLALSATPGNTVDAIQVGCCGAAASRRQAAGHCVSWFMQGCKSL